MSVPVPNGSTVGAVPTRTYRARISYVHHGRPGDHGDVGELDDESVRFERGREWIAESVHPNGSRTLRVTDALEELTGQPRIGGRTR